MRSPIDLLMVWVLPKCCVWSVL